MSAAWSRGPSLPRTSPGAVHRLDLVVAPRDVIGLVGVNGAGKSTLLRLLAGLAAPDQGSVAVSPATASIGHLPQETARVPGETVRGFVGRRTGVTAATAILESATTALSEGVPGADDAYAAALERWLDLGGADLEERTEEVADDLGLATELLDAEMTSLSGGQAARANLASLLLARFDVFLLDEPTNDLDLAGLDRLERWVRELRAGTVLVRTTSAFLARTVTLGAGARPRPAGGHALRRRLRDLPGRAETARRHAPRPTRSTRTARQADRADATQKQWMEKGVRDARKKASDPDEHVKRFRATSEKPASNHADERRIERHEVVEEPRKEWKLRMSIAAARAPARSSPPWTARSSVAGTSPSAPSPCSSTTPTASRSPGPTGPASRRCWPAARRLTPTRAAPAGFRRRGRRGRQARGLSVGDVAASTSSPASPARPLALREIRTLLAKFGLGSEHVHRGADTLSPGERTRAALALLQARGVNLLVLDEPTNHLDLTAIEQLETALASFEGTLLLVSHDRRLLAGVATTRGWHLDARAASSRSTGVDESTLIRTSPTAHRRPRGWPHGSIDARPRLVTAPLPAPVSVPSVPSGAPGRRPTRTTTADVAPPPAGGHEDGDDGPHGPDDDG